MMLINSIKTYFSKLLKGKEETDDWFPSEYLIELIIRLVQLQIIMMALASLMLLFVGPITVFNKKGLPIEVSVLFVFSTLLGLFCILSSFLNKRLPSRMQIPSWRVLASFFEKISISVSYVTLAFIQTVAYVFSLELMEVGILKEIPFPINLKLVFFASWFLSVALILFSVTNPIKGARKEDSPDRNNSLVFLRALIFWIFLLGMTCSTIVFLKGAWLVFNA